MYGFSIGTHWMSFWYQKGSRICIHHTVLPAEESTRGHKSWYKHGKLIKEEERLNTRGEK